jgi:hypothetical protein
MDFKVGDIGFAIEDEELGYIMKVEVTSVDDMYITYENDAIETEILVEECGITLFKTYDDAALYVKSTGVRPKLLTFQE